MYYIEQLVSHSKPSLKEKKVKKSLLEKLQPLSKVLKKLEVELRTNSERYKELHQTISTPSSSWVEEFVSSPNHGHIALIDLLKDLIQYPGLLSMTHKYIVLQRNPVSI